MSDTIDVKEQDLGTIISSIRKIIENTAQYKDANSMNVENDTAIDVDHVDNQDSHNMNDILELTNIIASDKQQSESLDHEPFSKQKILNNHIDDQGKEAHVSHLIEAVVEKMTEPLIEKWIENNLHALVERILLKKLNQLFTNKK